ncbi:hypothetical protein DSO57_1026257 [Entomophthora muscae]|uniref:Uncharacterized protein n=1 Tax=Entomophthora muscae TaxID=34485 RepID=A0ACC2RGU6_9FUNG|nr:hypothetical protein DSO57_1026257 [Entomophthora muscae]
MSTQDIASLIKSFNQFRANSRDADTKFNGNTHQLMKVKFVESFLSLKFLKDLQKHFGKKGTDAGEIIKALGKPDQMAPQIPEITRDEILKKSDSEAADAKMPGGIMPPLAPGPFMGTSISDSGSSDSYYLVYEWRGKHDYMYFKVNAQTEKVISSDWYHALD